jgi:hypothetical protein
MDRPEALSTDDAVDVVSSRWGTTVHKPGRSRRVTGLELPYVTGCGQPAHVSYSGPWSGYDTSSGKPPVFCKTCFPPT